MPSETSAAVQRVALVGSPNAGKTTLFNALTGLRAKTANYPGVTVTRRVGTVRLGERTVTLEDLPGTYSLEPVSPDEQVVSDLLEGRNPDAPPPDALLLVVDATTLQRSLVLVGQALRLGLPSALVLTMIDEVEAGGGSINIPALSNALGIEVIGAVGTSGRGVKSVRGLLENPAGWPRPVLEPPVTPRAWPGGSTR